MADVTMPRLSDTMEEGKILRWLKREGDRVEAGELLVEVETDKADMEVESSASGVLKQVKLAEGQTAPVGAVIAVIDAGDGAPAGSGGNGKSEATAVPRPSADASISAASASRFAFGTAFESLTPSTETSVGRTTAAATTGPASGPMPTSSTPATSAKPAPHKARSVNSLRSRSRFHIRASLLPPRPVMVRAYTHPAPGSSLQACGRGS